MDYGCLSSKYESNGDPGCIADSEYDYGGKSYGAYQFSSKMGAVDDFIKWLHGDDESQLYYGLLSQYEVGTTEFDVVWKALAGAFPAEFEIYQRYFIRYKFYDVAECLLSDKMYNLENHSDAMKCVVWSRAVQYGAGNIVEMFTEACNKLGYPNLSYVDHKYFDKDMIEAIYEVCATDEWTSGSPGLRPGLRARFTAECNEALEILAKES